ncbi:MAG: isoprenylcysteine carboxylmethyltransferase family protein [Acidobacteriota bacterium]
MTGERDAANVRVPPPLLVLAAIVGAAGLQRLWPLAPMVEVPAALRLSVGGMIIAVAVLVLGGWALALFRRGGQNPSPWMPTPTIETRGPYRVSRNPMYLGLVLVCCGAAIAKANLYLLALTPIVAWLLQRLAIVPEETYLEAKFGEEYLAYKRRVRRWL